jgi:osomolarity two-component system sensor histidine kinase SLN1
VRTRADGRTPDVINFDVFILFLLYVHHALETAERRLYTLREQLKIQFRATQKAQVNERKAGDSKRRLTS